VKVIDYTMFPYGLLVIYFPDEDRKVTLQGEEAYKLYGQLESCKTEEQQQTVLDQYSILLED